MSSPAYIQKKPVTVRVRPNLALVKYWGKTDTGINIPATPSLGLTLDGIYSETRLEITEKTASPVPSLFIDGIEQDSSRFNVFFNEFLRMASSRNSHLPDNKNPLSGLLITSRNNFPTAAGFASSSSGFGALAFGLDRLFGTGFSLTELSSLARTGSGSAARTIFGGFVDFPENASHAKQFMDEGFWPEFRIIAVTVSAGPKEKSSRFGMEHTKVSSPYYPAWVENSHSLYAELKEALLARDMEKTGEIARLSCLRMFATMLSADPPLLYWKPATLEILAMAEKLRRNGTGVWETMDAGPQVKLLCLESDTACVVREIKNLSLEHAVLAPGSGPEVLE